LLLFQSQHNQTNDGAPDLFIGLRPKAALGAYDNGESRDPFLSVTGSQGNTRTWATMGPGFRRDDEIE